MFTQHDVEKRVAAINAVLSDKDIHWEKRVAAVSDYLSLSLSLSLRMQCCYVPLKFPTVEGAEVCC